MNQLKKLLFGLAAFSLLAAPVMAQGVAFNVTSLPRQVRVEGNTEAIGEVTLTATNGGTIALGSSITLIYSGTITNPGGVTLTCVFAPAAPAACPGTITATPSGSQLTLSFTAAVAFGTIGDSITVAENRVNVAALGAGTLSVTVTLSGTSAAPTTNPITFNQATVPVGVVQSPSTAVALGAAAPGFVTCALPAAGAPLAAGVPVVGGALVAPAALSGDFHVKVTENFPAALTSTVDEAGFTPTTTVIANGTTVTITVSGVPAGFTLTPGAAVSDVAGTLTIAAAPAATVSTGADIAVAYAITASSTAAVEAVTFPFHIGFGAAGGAAPPIGATTTVTATVSLSPVDTSSPFVLISFTTNTQGTGTVGTIADCNTFLLFPWTVYTGDGALDTGFAIANTTADLTPATFGTTAQTGDVTLHFFAQTGTSPAPVTIATALAPGGTATAVLSTTLSAAFQGYVIAVCNFQLGHGFAFINNPAGLASGAAFAESYLALSLTNPRPAITESSGH